MYFNFSNTPLFPLSQNTIYYQSFPLFLCTNTIISPYITPVISPIIIANTHNQSATIPIAFSLHSTHSVVPIITLDPSHNQKLHQATTAAAAKQLKVIPIKNNMFLIFSSLLAQGKPYPTTFFAISFYILVYYSNCKNPSFPLSQNSILDIQQALKPGNMEKLALFAPKSLYFAIPSFPLSQNSSLSYYCIL